MELDNPQPQTTNVGFEEQEDFEKFRKRRRFSGVPNPRILYHDRYYRHHEVGF